MVQAVPVWVCTAQLPQDADPSLLDLLMLMGRKGGIGAAAGIKAHLADLFWSVLSPPSRKAQEREETSLVCNLCP